MVEPVCVEGNLRGRLAGHRGGTASVPCSRQDYPDYEPCFLESSAINAGMVGRPDERLMKARSASAGGAVPASGGKLRADVALRGSGFIASGQHNPSYGVGLRLPPTA